MENITHWLIEKSDFYNRKSFINDDPISVPHAFTKKEDVEIAGLFSAIIAWGNRKSIVSSANQLMQRMGNEPYRFVCEHSEKDLQVLNGFVHRTFNALDASTLCSILKDIYQRPGGLQAVFSELFKQSKHATAAEAIEYFRKIAFQTEHEHRFEKHLSSPERGSAAKRLNMYLRWMVRRDDRGVDFGIWADTFPMSQLLIPLDVHSARVARGIGILNRKQTDIVAVREVTSFCSSIDAADPARFDFALFGAGVFEKHYL